MSETFIYVRGKIEHISENAESLANEEQSRDVHIDPLQKRLKEEQIKYVKLIDSQVRKEILNSEINLVEGEPNKEHTKNVSESSKIGTASDLPETPVSENADTPPKRRGRPPKKYVQFVSIEKVKARNPLTESARTRQQRNYEENMAFKFFCTECSFKSKRQSHFLNHVQCHKTDGSEKKYSCKECDFISISPIMLKRHELKHKAVIYRCKVCTVYTTDRPGLLQRHVRLKHSSAANSITFPCTECSFVSKTPQGLARHYHKHKKAEEAGDKQEEEACKKCGKGFKNKMHLIRHMKYVHGPQVRPHLCDTCGKAFKRTDALQQHKIVHLEKVARLLPFKCETCSKAFRSQAHLKEHMSMHSTERPFLCQYCGASFKTQPVQKKHILTLHIKPKTHVCAICCRQFNTKHALQRHESTHSKSDPATEAAVLELQKSESALDIGGSHNIVDLSGLSETQRATIVLNNQSTECLVQDFMGAVSSHQGEESIDQDGQTLQQNFIQENQDVENLHQNFIQDNQETSSMYYF